MKKLIISIVGLFCLAAPLMADGLGEGIGRGWNVTVVTGASLTVFEGRGYVKAVYLTTGPTTSLGDYIAFYSTAPNLNNGGGILLFPPGMFASTASVIPTMVYKTTTSVTAAADNLNNAWTAGSCDTCYLEVSGANPPGGFVLGGLHVRQSVVSTGEAGKAYIYWRR